MPTRLPNEKPRPTIDDELVSLIGAAICDALHQFAQNDDAVGFLALLALSHRQTNKPEFGRLIQPFLPAIKRGLINEDGEVSLGKEDIKAVNATIRDLRSTYAKKAA